MRRLIVLGLVVALLGCISYAQEEPAPEPQPAPAEKPQPAGEEKKPEPQAQKPEEKKDDRVVVYIDVVDKVDGEPYKWRSTEYLIQCTFELANPEMKEKFKDEWRKRYDWSKYSKDKMEKKLEKDYQDLRKQKGVDKLNLAHLKVIRYRPKPKEAQEQKKAGNGKKDEEGQGPEQPEGESGKPEEKPAGPAGEKDKPAGEGGKPEENPAVPNEEAKSKLFPEKTWVDPKETADYLILGEANFKKGEKAIYFGETVAWNSIAEYEIRVIRRADGKEIKKIKTKPDKRSDPNGQDAAHQRCMREIGQKVATEIVNLPVFREKRK
jgi:hypothetical protein